eukprot:TRINITY_DN5296_c0_g1_i4.p1 TRINITY_DN5296_c0_g1~~TRINITY_DN5296_c0_g1_i4.p1  ORF type:complete len:1404 (-),score=304.85 TRINITY_DN5296_c0_g1_i4:28-4098(-)
MRFHLLLVGVLLLSSKTFSQAPVIPGAGTIPAGFIASLSFDFFVHSNTPDVVSFQSSDFTDAKDDFLSPDTDATHLRFIISEQIIPADEWTLGGCCDCLDIHAVPLFVSGMVLVHNIDNSLNVEANRLIKPLVIDRAALLAMATRSMTWTDNNITSINSNVTLPNQPITFIYQSCSSDHSLNDLLTSISGSSGLWSSSVCPEDDWPAHLTQRYTSDHDVLMAVQNTPNSIGLMRYSYAITELESSSNIVHMTNLAGRTLAPQPSTFTAGSLDFSSSIGVNANKTIVDGPGMQSWPLSTMYYATLRNKNMECSQANTLYGFFQYLLTQYSVRKSAEGAGFAIPTDAILSRSTAFLQTISCCSSTSKPVIFKVYESNVAADALEMLRSSYFDTTVYDFHYTNVASSSDVLDMLTNQGDLNSFGVSITLPLSNSTLSPVCLLGMGLSCVYNLNDTRSTPLSLNRSALAGIFGGEITRWSEVTGNVGLLVGQPSAAINLAPFNNVDEATVFVRALDSFDSQYSYDDLFNGGYADMLAYVASTPFSIGCGQMNMGIVLPNGVRAASMVNRAGNTVVLSPATVQAAMQAVPDHDLYIHDAPGTNSWPLSAWVYFIFDINAHPSTSASTYCATQQALAQFIVDVVTTEELGNDLETKTGWVMPPESILQSIQVDLNAIKCHGESLYTLQSVLVGEGSSLSSLLFESWSSAYSTLVADVEVQYTGADTLNRTSPSFQSFEAPLANIDKVYVPVAAGALAIVYNLPGVPVSTHLVLTRDVLVGIYAGSITRWNHARITSLNPSLNLTAAAIIPLYQGNSSTTYVLLQALTSFDREAFPARRIGQDPGWPVPGIMVGSNRDMSSKVITIPYSIGYTGLSYAIVNNLPYAEFAVNGEIVSPTTQSVLSALYELGVLYASYSALQRSSLPPVLDLTRASLPASYPISYFVNIVVPRNPTNYEKAVTLMSFVLWTFTSPLPARASSLGFVSLPRNLTDLSKARMGDVRYLGQTVLAGCDGIIGSQVVIDACGVCGGLNDTCCRGTPEQIQTNCIPCRNATENWALSKFKCDGFLDCEDNEDDIDCNIRSIVRISQALSGIATFGITATVLILIDILIHRQEQVFRENNVFFMTLILIGCIIGYSTVYVLSQLSRLNKFVCGVQYWFFGFAFVLTFGAMIAKTLQVYLLHRQQSGDLSQFTNVKLLKYVGGALAVEILILVIWTSTDVPVPSWGLRDPSDPSKFHLFCSNKSFDAFAALLGAFKGVLLVSGVVLSFLTRNLDYSGNESRLIRTTIFATAFAAAIILPLLFIFSNNPLAKITLSNGAILLAVTFIIIIYFGPKIVAYHFPNSRLLGKTDSGRSKLLGPIDI